MSLLVTFFIYSSVYMFIPVSQFSPPPPLHPKVCFIHLWLYFCFVDNCICILNSPHTSMHFLVFHCICLNFLNENTQHTLWCPHLLHIMTALFASHTPDSIDIFSQVWMCHILFYFIAFKQVALSAWNSFSLKLISLLPRQSSFFFH